MDSATFLSGRVTLHAGDCLTVLRELDANSFDSCVTDPPYGLEFMGRHWDSFKTYAGGNPNMKPQGKVIQGREEGWMPGRNNGYRQKNPRCRRCGKLSRGNGSCKCPEPQWDTRTSESAYQFQCFCEDWAREVWRVLKPGAHLVAFAAPKNAHRMFCAIEDGGFEIRDTIAWLFGSGFPKSHDVSKAIDRYLGAERSKVRVDSSQVRNPKATGAGRDGMEGATRPWIEAALERGYHEAVSDEAVSDEAASFQGWGTALKPAYEPICLARKPLVGTVAANVLKHGVGAINIDACRVATGEDLNGGAYSSGDKDLSLASSYATGVKAGTFVQPLGRWPANVIHDGSDEVVEAFPETGPSIASAGRNGKDEGDVFSLKRSNDEVRGHNDSGSAARFFYSSKADADDRIGSKHPTVKPLDLMQYLVRLVTPPRGTILDPFAGTGTTAEAAWREGFNAILIEREPEYLADIERRMSLCLAGPDERARESIKARQAGKPQDNGPLFDEARTA